MARLPSADDETTDRRLTNIYVYVYYIAMHTYYINMLTELFEATLY